jgi:hypothetical protein
MKGDSDDHHEEHRDPERMPLRRELVRLPDHQRALPLWRRLLVRATLPLRCRVRLREAMIS